MQSKILLTIIALVPATFVSATPPLAPVHFEAKFVPAGQPLVGTPLQVKISITKTSPHVISFCNPFRVSYDKTGRIQLIDAPITEHTADSGQTFQTQITVLCAANDTATIAVVFRCVNGKGGWGTRWYAVSNESTVAFCASRPRLSAPKAEPRIMQRERFQKELQADTAQYRRIDTMHQAPLPLPDTIKISKGSSLPDSVTIIKTRKKK